MSAKVQAAVAAVIQEANAQRIAVSVAVVNDSGVLWGFSRLDGSPVGPVDVSLKKARTAALFATDSIDFAQFAQPAGGGYTLEHSNGGLISIAGGVTLWDQGKVAGGIGVAGASPEQDEALARVGAAAFEGARVAH